MTITDDTLAAAGRHACRPRGPGPPARADPDAPIAIAALRAASRALVDRDRTTA